MAKYAERECNKCGRLKPKTDQYYMMINGRYSTTCIECMKEFSKNNGNTIEKFLESNPQIKKQVADDSKANIKKPPVIMSESDIENMNYILNVLGYDPFDSENDYDKKNLYNKLIDFLDDSTLEDSFKLPIVIEIVKSFNQIDKINQAIANLTKKDIEREAARIKSLISTKKDIMSGILSMAKDNGISVNHSNNKSVGAGTLSGIIKQLQEKGVEAAEINLYDVETCQGMRQVADISNKSIMNQLMLNDNDYTDMIAEQRTMIKDLQIKVDALQEENRLLKVRIKQFEQ